jgi:hypothetical protein
MDPAVYGTTARIATVRAEPSGAVVASALSGGLVPSNGGRSRPSKEEDAFPPKRHLRIVKDELADEEQSFVRGPMKVDHVEYAEDIIPSAERARNSPDS